MRCLTGTCQLPDTQKLAAFHVYIAGRRIKDAATLLGVWPPRCSALISGRKEPPTLGRLRRLGLQARSDALWPMGARPSSQICARLYRTTQICPPRGTAIPRALPRIDLVTPGIHQLVGQSLRIGEDHLVTSRHLHQPIETEAAGHPRMPTPLPGRHNGVLTAHQVAFRRL